MLGLILKERHISRASLAHRLGVSTQTVHNWCSGRVRVPVGQLGPLCDWLEGFGVPSGELAQMTALELERRGLREERFARKTRGAQPVVMLMTWNLMSPSLFGPTSQVARAALEGAGFQCVVTDCGAEPRLIRSYVAWAVSSGVEGLLLCGVPGEPPDPDNALFSALRPATAAGIPVVLLKPWTGASVAMPEGVGNIGWDSLAAVERAGGLLLDAGHTRIRAVLAGAGAGFGGRYRGLDKAWANLGLPFDEESVIWAEDGETPEEVADALAGATAVFAPPSHLPTIARACFAAGLRWPEELSIVSLGNRQFVPQLDRRPFTFVTIPIGKVGRGAAQLLAGMIRGERFQTGQESVIYGASAMSVENLEGGSIAPPRAAPLASSPLIPAPGPAISQSGPMSGSGPMSEPLSEPIEAASGAVR